MMPLAEPGVSFQNNILVMSPALKFGGEVLNDFVRNVIFVRKLQPIA